jgi:hypothetical protein
MGLARHTRESSFGFVSNDWGKPPRDCLPAVAAARAPTTAGASATTAAAAAAPTASGSGASAVAAAATAAALVTGAGFVDDDRTAVDGLPVERGDGPLGLLVGPHLDEGESSRLTRHAVLHHEDALDVP